MNSDLTPNHHQNSEVSFRPLHSGMGFHPFPDGLPYTTPNKNRAPAPERPMPTQAQPTFRAPVRQFTTPVKSPVKVEAEPRKIPLLKDTGESLGISYLLKRVVAYSLDFAIHSSLVTAVVALAFWFNEIDPRILVDSGMLLVAGVFLIGFNWFLVMLQETLFQTSLGKSAFRLVLPTSRLKIFLRALLFIPSALLGIGLILGLFNRKRRCLHDFLLDAQPIRVTKL